MGKDLLSENLEKYGFQGVFGWAHHSHGGQL